MSAHRGRRRRSPNTPPRILIVVLAAAIALVPAAFGPGPRTEQHQARADINAADGGARLGLYFSVHIAEIVG